MLQHLLQWILNYHGVLKILKFKADTVHVFANMAEVFPPDFHPQIWEVSLY